MQQKRTQHCKATSLQLKINFFKTAAWNPSPRLHRREGPREGGYQPWRGDRGRTLELSVWRVSRKRDGKGMFSRLSGQAEEKEGATGEEDAVVSDS